MGGGNGDLCKLKLITHGRLTAAVGVITSVMDYLQKNNNMTFEARLKPLWPLEGSSE